MPTALRVTLALLATLLPHVSGLTCHVCRSQPPSASGPASANSTLGLILTLALHSPPDCRQFSADHPQFRTECPLGLNSTCAVAEDTAGRRVKTCFGAARGAQGCFTEPGGTFCLCRGELCNEAAVGAMSVSVVLVVGLVTALAVW
ncbi:hypothetical protein FJT64_013827 [Amphibalanus amphitrite]|uniref:Protein sleepless n=1 Tax=Amphibalanus amphitrite TaxID=1232801 RepID=A0A6A4UVJ3_AMPAM|nr:hypothetical protein FJT64_013827 [Amphibalanus amphitrite]